MQLIVDLVVVALAANGLVDAWKNGSLFEGLRADIQARQDDTDPESKWQVLWELLLCSFCHSYHVGVWLFVLLTISDWRPSDDLSRSLTQLSNYGQWIAWMASIPYGSFLRAVVFGVAAARLSWLLNGMLPKHLRYDRAKELPSGPAPTAPPDGSATPSDGSAYD